MTEVVFKSEPTGADAPAADNQGDTSSPSSRPEGLPENFDSVEALANSFKEAQAELTRMKQGNADSQQDTSDTADDASKNDDGQDAGEDQAKQDTSQLPENLQPFSEEYADKGELTEDSYTKLAELGYSKEVVDAYIKGVTGGIEAPSADDVKVIKDAVGGDEEFGKLQTWAGENLSDPDLEAYNNAIGNKATAKMAVEWLQSKMQSVEGFEPKVTVEGANAGGSEVKGYTSTAELSRDQRNPLYKQGDKAFHAMVEAKLAKTTAF